MRRKLLLLVMKLADVTGEYIVSMVPKFSEAKKKESYSVDSFRFGGQLKWWNWQRNASRRLSLGKQCHSHCFLPSSGLHIQSGGIPNSRVGVDLGG